jgi:hypothetical protein
MQSDTPNEKTYYEDSGEIGKFAEVPPFTDWHRHAPPTGESPMILVNYGVTKSGTTLAFELARGILIDNGFAQEGLPDSLVVGNRMNLLRHRVIWPGVMERVVSYGAGHPELVAGRHVPPNPRATLRHSGVTKHFERFIAVKTHSPLNFHCIPYLEELIESQAVVVHVTYRDPRDVCLSLLDAGARSRRDGRRQFSKMVTLDDAIAYVSRQLEQLRVWGSVRGVSLYRYDDLAFDIDHTIERMEWDLGLHSDRDAVKKRVSSVPTQKNKAKRHRHEDELTPEQNRKCLDVFGSFIEEVILNGSYAWFFGGSARKHAA